MKFTAEKPALDHLPWATVIGTPVSTGTVHWAVGVAVGDALGDGEGEGEPGLGVGVAVGTGVGLGVGLGVGVDITVLETRIDWVRHDPTVPAGTLCHTMFCPLPPFVERFAAEKPAMVDPHVLGAADLGRPGREVRDRATRRCRR